MGRMIQRMILRMIFSRFFEKKTFSMISNLWLPKVLISVDYGTL